jgi:Protein of unknown function (DUF2934)
MEPDLSDRTRERAYEIWIASGYHDGEAEQHWLAAEKEILSAQLSRAQELRQSGSGAARHLNDPRDEFLGARAPRAALQAR